MWIYEKRLQYPINIKKPNAQLAKVIITQYGGLSRVGKMWTTFIYIQQLLAFQAYERSLY